MFSAQYAQKITNLFQTKGQFWLYSLPIILLELVQKWQLEPYKPLDNLSYNYVCKAYTNKYKTSVIIKIGCDAQEIFREVNALKCYNSNACVKLLDYDKKNNAILLEELKPGNSLKTLFPYEDEVAVTHTTNLIKRLSTNPINDILNFPKIEHWLEGLVSKNFNNTKLNKHIKKAKSLSLKLFNSAKKSVFLHGDLHHDNILLNGKNWIAIDPKGVIGEIEYEIGAFIRNPCKELIAHPDVERIISKRCEIFANLLNLDKQRIKDWYYMQSVLASCWAEDDNDDGMYQEFITLAGIMEHTASK